MTQEMTFGEYFKLLIKNKGYSFVEFRSKIELSKTYLIDIQKGLTYPTPEMQIRMADLLNLYDDEREIFFDKASLGRKELPADIVKYLSTNNVEIENIRERMRA